MSLAPSFIPIRNGKLAAAEKLQRHSIVIASLIVLPSASGGQCGFMTIGYRSPSQSPQKRAGMGQASL